MLALLCCNSGLSLRSLSGLSEVLAAAKEYDESGSLIQDLESGSHESDLI